MEMGLYFEDTWFYVQCTNCGANGPEEDTAEKARGAWNNTSPPQTK